MKIVYIFGVGALVLVEAGLLGLATWQYHRMQEKDQMAAQLAARAPVALQGVWQNDATFVLDNQPNPQDATIGWRVLTPLVTSDSVVVVDRGWVPLPADRTAPPDVARYVARLEKVEGVWADYPQRHGWLRGPDTTNQPRILAWLNPSLITSATLGPQYLQATTATAAAMLAVPPASPDGSRHASYALQWLLMAVAFPLLVGWRMRK